jgi:CSLREA domain-containing protein
MSVTKSEDTFDGACLPRDCSLREAVAAANQASGPNTITIPAGNYVLALAGPGEDGAASGDLDLTDDVTLLGVGSEAGGTFITAADGFGDRLVHALSGAVVIENLYLGGGEADAGGAVRVEESADLTIRETRLDASKATGPDGGGLVFSEGTLILEASRLTRGCSAGAGGAVVSRGTATIRDAVFEDNEAASQGGAIANSGTMTLTTTSVNRAFAGTGPLCGVVGQGDGGGIYSSGDLTITDGDISRTEATRSGGAIFTDGTLDIEGTLIRSTCRGSGGGIAVAAGGRATVKTIDLQASAGGGDGGGVWVEEGGSASVVDSRIGGTASRAGGGIANAGEVEVRGTTVSGGRALDGAGIYSSGALTVETSTIEQGSAREHGGGIFALGTTTIDASTISGNTADFGGGLFLQGTVSVTNCTISANNATGSGGGAALWGSGELQLTHCTLTRNTSAEASALLADTYATVSNTLLGGNTLGPNCSVRLGLLGIGNLDEDGSCGFSAAENLSGVSPELGPLLDNGGPTETHVLLADSPARNAAAVAVCLPTDQRGVVRPQESLCDIGAVEMEPAD